jgi:hypothetical protein
MPRLSYRQLDTLAGQLRRHYARAADALAATRVAGDYRPARAGRKGTPLLDLATAVARQRVAERFRRDHKLSPGHAGRIRGLVEAVADAVAALGEAVDADLAALGMAPSWGEYHALPARLGGLLLDVGRLEEAEEAAVLSARREELAGSPLGRELQAALDAGEAADRLAATMAYPADLKAQLLRLIDRPGAAEDGPFLPQELDALRPARPAEGAAPATAPAPARAARAG